MAEPEADPERDQRTVFAYQVIEMPLNCIVLLWLVCTCTLLTCKFCLQFSQISLKADERDVYDFFSRV